MEGRPEALDQLHRPRQGLTNAPGPTHCAAAGLGRQPSDRGVSDSATEPVSRERSRMGQPGGRLWLCGGRFRGRTAVSLPQGAHFSRHRPVNQPTPPPKVNPEMPVPDTDTTPTGTTSPCGSVAASTCAKVAPPWC